MARKGQSKKGPRQESQKVGRDWTQFKALKMAGVRATQFGLQNSENQNLVANAKNALLGKTAVTRSTRTALGELGNKAGANRTALRAKDTNIPGISIYLFISPTYLITSMYLFVNMINSLLTFAVFLARGLK